MIQDSIEFFAVAKMTTNIENESFLASRIKKLGSLDTLEISFRKKTLVIYKHGNQVVLKDSIGIVFKCPIITSEDLEKFVNKVVEHGMYL